jgi:hypothetical protein
MNYTAQKFIYDTESKSKSTAFDFYNTLFSFESPFSFLLSMYISLILTRRVRKIAKNDC